MFLLIKKLLIRLPVEHPMPLYRLRLMFDAAAKIMIPLIMSNARPVPNGAKRFFDVNCYRERIIDVNSNKIFSNSNDH
jgi:hypothetical protein